MKDKLPSPRLELRWKKIGDTWEESQCTYSLVIPLKEGDIRGDFEGNPTEQILEINTTKVSTNYLHAPIFNGVVDTPSKDEMHAVWDKEALGNHLPIVAICEETWSLVESGN